MKSARTQVKKLNMMKLLKNCGISKERASIMSRGRTAKSDEEKLKIASQLASLNERVATPSHGKSASEKAAERRFEPAFTGLVGMNAASVPAVHRPVHFPDDGDDFDSDDDEAYYYGS